MKIEINRIAPEGEGIGKAQGSDKVVFVTYALPGEVVEASVAQEKDRFTRANLARVITASSSRVQPPCPHHFTPGAPIFCGGCDWQQASYPEQLRLKRAIIEDCLRRIGKIQCPVDDVLPSPEQWRYRNKVQIPFQPSQASSPDSFVAGFYAPGSHRIVEFEDCLVQPELSVRILKTVKDLAVKYRWPVYDEHQGKGWLRHLYIRTNNGGKALVALITRTPEFQSEKEFVAELLAAHSEIISLWQNVQREKTSVILGPQWRKLAGHDRMRERIGAHELEFSPGAFLQVNTPAAEVLYGAAEKLLFEGGFKPRLVLDLYSGIGAIAFWIAKKTPRVIGVEEVPQAVDDAYHNARRLKLNNVNFVKGKAEFALRKMRGLDSPRPWAAIVDPPRAGCEQEVLRFLAHRKIERIVYVSCNPATFARDANRLTSLGYSVKRVQPADLFPQTSHVELVSLIDRK